MGLAARPGADAPEPDPPSPIFRRLHVKLRADDHTALTTGDRVRIRAMLRGPPPPSTPGGRDPQRDAFFSGLGGSGYALSAVMQAGPAGDRPHGLLQRIRRLRETIAGRIMTVLPGPAWRGCRHPSHRARQRHPAGRSGCVRGLRTGTSAGGGGAASRHRHGAGADARPHRAGAVGMGFAAAALPADRGIGGPGGGRPLHAADRAAPAGAAQSGDGGDRGAGHC